MEEKDTHPVRLGMTMLSGRTGKKSLVEKRRLAKSTTSAKTKNARSRFVSVEVKMNDLVKLSEVCSAWGLSERVAKRKAALGLLPAPAFRLAGTQKGPWFVRKSDLEALAEREAEKASKLHKQMQSVT